MQLDGGGADRGDAYTLECGTLPSVSLCMALCTMNRLLGRLAQHQRDVVVYDGTSIRDGFDLTQYRVGVLR